MTKREWGIVNATSSWLPGGSTVLTPPGTEKLRVKLAKRQGEGSVWFDEVQLTAAPGGLVRNGGFEVIGREDPMYWRYDSQEGWEISKQVVYEGDRAMKADQSWSWLSQEFLVRGERWYTLEAEVKSDIMLGEKLEGNENTFLTLECLDKEDNIIKREWGIVTAFPLWHKRETKIYAPGNTRKIRIRLAKRKGEGSVWFDGVKMKERLFFADELPEKLTPVVSFFFYSLLVFSFLAVVLKTRSKGKGKSKKS